MIFPLYNMYRLSLYTQSENINWSHTYRKCVFLNIKIKTGLLIIKTAQKRHHKCTYGKQLEPSLTESVPRQDACDTKPHGIIIIIIIIIKCLRGRGVFKKNNTIFLLTFNGVIMRKSYGPNVLFLYMHTIMCVYG